MKKDKNAKGYYVGDIFIEPSRMSEGTRQQLTEASARFERELRQVRKMHGVTQRELSEREPVFLRQIEKLEADLKITQATFDSINALHTKAVGELAKQR